MRGEKVREKICGYIVDIQQVDKDMYRVNHANGNAVKVIKADSLNEAINRTVKEIEKNGLKNFRKVWGTIS